jgi:hypothetical protein
MGAVMTVKLWRVEDIACQLNVRQTQIILLLLLIIPCRCYLYCWPQGWKSKDPSECLQIFPGEDDGVGTENHCELRLDLLTISIILVGLPLHLDWSIWISQLPCL